MVGVVRSESVEDDSLGVGSVMVVLVVALVLLERLDGVLAGVVHKFFGILANVFVHCNPSGFGELLIN